MLWILSYQNARVDGTLDDVNLLCSVALTYFMPYWRETIENKTDKILKRFQVDGVCRMDSASSWPQGEDSNSRSLFGRWLQEAWTGQWERKTGKGNAANTVRIIQWLMLWATEVPSSWETSVKHTSELSQLRARALWYFPTRSHLSVLEDGSLQGC